MSIDASAAPGNKPSHNHKVALDLAARGIAIFPCQPVDGPPDHTGHPQWRAKRPMPRIKWKEAATTDVEIINAWWGANPAALVGMPLGPRDIIALDVDRHPDAPDGVVAFNELCRIYPGLGEGPCVDTPNGGQHYLFQQITPRHGNAEGALPPGINVRGEGGYVIAPGCVLPDGRGWVMRNGDKPIRSLPRPIIDMLQGVAPPEEPAFQSHDPLDDITYPADPRQAAYMRESVRNAFDKVVRATPGTRNNTLNTQAVKLAHFVPRFLDENEVADLLTEAAITAGLDTGEIGPTIASGMRKGMAQPIDPFDVANEYWDFEPAFGEKPDKPTERPRIWRGDELWDIPPVSYLIGDLIPRGTVGLMVGASQTFKSFMALDMALAICQGHPKWHGHVIEAPDDAIVLYIAGEGGIEGISQRRRGWATYHKLTRATMRDRFRLITHGVNLTSKDSRKLLVEAITEQLAQDQGKLVLIIVDTLNTVASGAEENSTKEMGALHNICVEISQHFGTAVMGVHHTNKQGDVRGSSVLTANMDFWMFIKRRVFSSMKIEMTVSKLKDAGAGHKEKYEMKLVGIDGSSATTLVPIRIGAEEDEIEPALGGRPAQRTEAITAVLSSVANGLTLTEICDLLGIVERKERQAVRRALYRGSVTGGFAQAKGKWSVTGDDGFFS